MFEVGQKVVFGRSNGEQTVGTVLKINAKSVKIRQDEPRGRYKVGTERRVHPNCVEALDPLTEALMPPRPVEKARKVTVGDTVTFEGRGRTLRGTVTKVNVKTVNVVPDDALSDSQYWRVSPHLLTLC